MGISATGPASAAGVGGQDIANQFDFIKSGELSASEAAVACGPTTTLAFARAMGRNPTIGEAMRLKPRQMMLARPRIW